MSHFYLAVAIIEAADDAEGRYGMRNVEIGLMRHFFPFLHLFRLMRTQDLDYIDRMVYLHWTSQLGLYVLEGHLAKNKVDANSNGLHRQ